MYAQVFSAVCAVNQAVRRGQHQFVRVAGILDQPFSARETTIGARVA